MDCQDFYCLKEAYLNIYEEAEKETHLESTEEMSSDKDKRRARMERKSKDKKKREYEDYNESLDYYDNVLSYLIDEGYADTIENAEVIMVNMSEAWIDSILEVTGGGEVTYANYKQRGMAMSPSIKSYAKKTGLEVGMENRARTIRNKMGADHPHEYYDDEDERPRPSIMRDMGERDQAIRNKRAHLAIKKDPHMKKMKQRWERISNAERNFN